MDILTELRADSGLENRLAELAEKTFAITNNHYKGKAAVNALELKGMLSQRKVKAPATLVEHYPELRDFTEPA